MLTIPQSGRGNPAKRESAGHVDDPAERERNRSEAELGAAKSRKARGRGARRLEHGAWSGEKRTGRRKAELTPANCRNSLKYLTVQ